MVSKVTSSSSRGYLYGIVLYLCGGLAGGVLLVPVREHLLGELINNVPVSRFAEQYSIFAFKSSLQVPGV